MIKFEDLKIGDRLKRISSDDHVEILAIGPEYALYKHIESGSVHWDKKENSTIIYYQYYTPPKQKKKIGKYFSPAIARYSVKVHSPKLYVTSDLYSTEEEAKTALGETFIKWPAAIGGIDSFRVDAIQYAVEVEE